MLTVDSYPSKDARNSTPEAHDERVRLLLEQALAHGDSGIAQAFLAHARALVRRDAEAARSARKASSFREQIYDYVESHLGSRIRIEELVALASLSTSHFHRIFRRRFGRSPMSYVMERRVRRAQSMITAGGETLIQISLACGFCDQAHFSRTFRRVVGMTPREWRRLGESDQPQRPDTSRRIPRGTEVRLRDLAAA